ncbi:YcxB family protein [Brevundimonas sp.]|jgi:hypothetical protein|uniref:YcxB family protein n=1 Tax=Brevundimonas sp. TaxID=1871086 RepID=UPI0037BEE2EF
MTAVVEVRGVKPTPKEGRLALKAWPALGLWARLPLLWLIVCLAGAGGLIAFSVGERIGWIIALLLAALYGFVGLNILAQRKLAALSRVCPISRRPVDWRVSGEGFSVVSAGLESRVDWRLVATAVEDRDRFIFALTPYSNFVLPLRMLDAAQLETVRDLIADARARGVLGAGVD